MPFVFDDIATVAGAISAGAAVTSTVNEIAGSARSANAARCVTVTIANNSPSMILIEKHKEFHGGLYYNCTEIPPWGRGIIQCESGGVCTGVAGWVKCGIYHVNSITQSNVDSLNLDSAMKRRARHLLAGGRQIVYFPSMRKRQGQLDIRVNNPFSGSNDFACDILNADEWDRLKGPTGLQSQSKRFKYDGHRTSLQWNATAGNKANMNVTLHL